MKFHLEQSNERMIMKCTNIQDSDGDDNQDGIRQRKKSLYIYI